MKRLALLAAVLVSSSMAPRVRADERDPPARVHAPLPGSDGVYGRLDGSLALGFAAGAELEDGEGRAALRIAGHYLWTAGVYARYSDGFGSGSQRPLRVVSLGLDLRPLFLPRFGLDFEQGPALLDLTLDSLSLTAGAYFAEPRAGGFGSERGFELGLGLAVPLLGEAAGPWLELRAERRLAGDSWSEAGPTPTSNAWLFSAFFSWHALTLSTDSDR